MRKIAFLLLIGFSVIGVVAQESCPAIVEAALQAVDAACVDTARNQACYGNFLLESEPQNADTTLRFEQPGDIANLADIKTLKLSGLDESTQRWGVALLKVQANLPDTLPGQNVTMLMFGDVEMTNLGSATRTPTLDVALAQDAKIYLAPSTINAAIAQLTAGDTLVANGRTSDFAWVRVRLADGQIGWTEAVMLEKIVRPEILKVIGPMDTSVYDYGPMQAFTFRAGIGTASCAEAPADGILIQTPEGAGKVAMQVNGAEIRFGSTLYLQTQQENVLAVNVLEGFAQVDSAGQSSFAIAGEQISLPLDAQTGTAQSPAPPQPYIAADVVTLPVAHLERKIVPPEGPKSPPATPLIPGLWIRTFDSCYPSALGVVSQVTVEDGGRVIRSVGILDGPPAAFNSAEFGPIQPLYVGPKRYQRLLRYVDDNHYVWDYGGSSLWYTMILAPDKTTSMATGTEDGCTTVSELLLPQ